MNNSSIYDYTFSVMKKIVKKNKKDIENHLKYKLYKPCLVLQDDISKRYGIISKSLSRVLRIEIEYLVMRLLKNNKVEYFAYDYKNICDGIPFYRFEENKKIAYVFSNEVDSFNYKQYLKDTNSDGLKLVLLGEKIGGVIDQIWECEEKKTDNKIQYITIKDVFELIDDNEYYEFCGYVNDFNIFVKHSLGYNTIIVPSEYSVKEFKRVELSYLSEFEYDKYLTGLDSDKLKSIKKNFFENGLINALLSDNDFADSFISAEWYYNTQIITAAIENTAVVAGYFKSIEQLLYKLIRFYDDTGKTIKKKCLYENKKIEEYSDEKKNYTGKYIDLSSKNVDKIDFSLGSMTACINYSKNRSIWNIDDEVIDFIIDRLKEYRVKYRNDHFHKDNLFSKEDIDKIREYTILLHYLLLGGFKLDEVSINILLEHREEVCDEQIFDYDSLSKWLDGILGGDNLLDINTNVCIQLNKNLRSIKFTSIMGVCEDGWIVFDENDPNLFSMDDYDIISDLADDELENIMMEYIKKYLNDGKYREKLKSFKSLYIGLDIRAKQVFIN